MAKPMPALVRSFEAANGCIFARCLLLLIGPAPSPLSRVAVVPAVAARDPDTASSWGDRELKVAGMMPLDPKDDKAKFESEISTVKAIRVQAKAVMKSGDPHIDHYEFAQARWARYGLRTEKGCLPAFAYPTRVPTDFPDVLLPSAGLMAQLLGCELEIYFLEQAVAVADAVFRESEAKPPPLYQTQDDKTFIKSYRHRLATHQQELEDVLKDVALLLSACDFSGHSKAWKAIAAGLRVVVPDFLPLHQPVGSLSAQILMVFPDGTRGYPPDVIKAFATQWDRVSIFPLIKEQQHWEELSKPRPLQNLSITFRVSAAPA
jgi:hypothetical protein